MCGRYASTKTSSEVAREFGALDAASTQAPGVCFNVAPTMPVLAVVQRHPRDEAGEPDPGRTERSVRVLRWGLVPSWAKDPSGAARMINARAETAAEKPAFRRALAARRCLLPATGWYEWKRSDAAKQPYLVTGSDGASLAMAGLWEFWRGDSGSEPLVTCAVLTTDAVGPLAEIHHRMPLLLGRDDWGSWLDPDRAPPAGLLAPPTADLVAGLELRPVSTLVNSVRNDGPELMRAVEVAEPALELDLPAPSAADRR